MLTGCIRAAGRRAGHELLPGGVYCGSISDLLSVWTNMGG